MINLLLSDNRHFWCLLFTQMSGENYLTLLPSPPDDAYSIHKLKSRLGTGTGLTLHLRGEFTFALHCCICFARVSRFSV